MQTLREAMVEGLGHVGRWMGGVAVVTDGDGGYDAIPGAYLNDISYTGAREVVIQINDLADVCGSEYTPDQGNAAAMADLADTVIETLPW